MNGNWAEAWVEAAYNQGITSGCTTKKLTSIKKTLAKESF
jgi:hypothetical protein